MLTKWYDSPSSVKLEPWDTTVLKREFAEGALMKRLQAIATAPSAVSKPILESGKSSNGGSQLKPDLNKVFEDEPTRALEILGRVGPKTQRDVNDSLKIELTKEQWCKLFNVAEGYYPSDARGDAFPGDTVAIYFRRSIRQVTEP